LEALSDPPAGQGNDVLLANVLVRLDDRARARVAFDLILRVSPAHHHARADYASALLQWRDYDEAWRVLEAQPTAPSGVDVERSGARRLDLLRLQWLTFEGRYGEAARLIETLQQRFPEDVDVQAARASFDAGRGRPADAEQHYQSAHQGAPERQDFADVLRELERQRSPKAFVQAEARGISGAWSATSTLATLEARPRPHVPVTLTAERASLTAPQFLFDDGHVAPLDARLSRFEAAVSAPIRSGTTLSAALFGSDRGAGAGTTFTHHDLRGSWKVTAERGRPFWEFVESVAGDGRKDRISVQRDWRFSADTAAWAIVDWNGYRLRSEAGAASTALTLGVIRTVRHQAPTLTLQYGLDKEHVRSADVVTTTDGRVFMPVPLTSREVHLAGAVTRFPIHRIWEVDASAGYTVDRFGGRGSFVTARATPTLRAPVGLELWGERRLYSLTTTQRVRRSGIRLTVRF
jgi:tetratricopeptide (TPR) repeat protein